MRRRELVARIQTALARWRVDVETATRSNLNDTSVQSEALARHLLNALYGWNLESANTSAANYPGVDLLDRGQRVAVQVTATGSGRKVQDTLDTIAGLRAGGRREHVLGEVERFCIFVLTEKQRSYPNLVVPEGVNFDHRRDIVDLSDVLRTLSGSAGLATVIAVHDLLAQEFLDRRHESPGGGDDPPPAEAAHPATRTGATDRRQPAADTGHSPKLTESWTPLSVYQSSSTLTVPPWAAPDDVVMEAGRALHRHIGWAYAEAVDGGAPKEFVYQLSLHVSRTHAAQDFDVRLALVCHVTQFVRSFSEMHGLFLGSDDTDAAYLKRTGRVSERLKDLKLRMSYVFQPLTPYRIAMTEDGALAMRLIEPPYTLRCPLDSSSLLVALSAFGRGEAVSYDDKQGANLNDRALWRYPVVAKHRRGHMELVAKDFEVSVHDPEAWRPSAASMALWKR